ncbi:MAG TPA: hypothetical protein VKD71_00920 [Gemmataceae bacterium]|nr:hypothetical protein [Gemmataceae bacterium]
MVRARWSILLATAVAALALGQSPVLGKPLLGKTPPELVANADD